MSSHSAFSNNTPTAVSLTLALTVGSLLYIARADEHDVATAAAHKSGAAIKELPLKTNTPASQSDALEELVLPQVRRQ